MSRLKSLALLASSCSPGRPTIVTSPSFSTLISIWLSFLRALPMFHQADTVSPALIAKITYLIDRLCDDIDAKPAFARAVEGGRRYLLGIKAVTSMIQPQENAVGERVGFKHDRLLGPPMIGMTGDIAGGLGDRKLELSDV